MRDFFNNPVVIIGVFIGLIVVLFVALESSVSNKKEDCESKGGAFVRLHGGTLCLKKDMVVQ
jgi:hypothetical protein